MTWGRLACVLVMVFVAALAAAGSVEAWSNGPNQGDGFGTHDWILLEAADLAGTQGAGWVNLDVALPQADDPDNVLQHVASRTYGALPAEATAMAPGRWRSATRRRSRP